MRRRWLWLGSALVVGLAVAAWGWARALEARQVRETLDRAKKEMAARLYHRAGQRLAALGAAKGAAEGEVDYQLGICELYQGRRDAAMAAWGRVPAGSPFAGKAAIQRSMLSMDSGQFTRAEEIALDALDREAPPEKGLYQALNLLYQFEGRTDDVRRVLVESWKSAESPATVVTQLYRLDTSPFPFEMARSVLAKGDRDDDRVWLARASLATKSGAFDEARKWLDACAKRTPEDRPVWRARLELAKATGDAEAAWHALEHLPAEGFSTAETARLRAWLAGQAGDASAEQKALTDLVAQEPGDTAALERLAALAGQAGDTREVARLRSKIAEMGEAKERYRILQRGETPRNAEELARLAEALGRKIEARGWALIRDGKASRGDSREALVPEVRGVKASAGKPSGPTLAERFADLRRARPESRLATNSGVLPQFVDDAEAAGLKFVHDNGQTPQKLLPETMSGGVALLDYDGDGWLDLYAVQGGHFPPQKDDSLANPGDRLFRNRRDGSFEDVSHASRIDQLARGYGHGAAVADFDNDGRPDLFLTRWDAYTLLRNRGDGAFDDVTSDAGLGGPRDWPTSAAWADLDNDGDLDLYVCHYLKFDPSKPHLCTQAESQENYYCSPRDFEPWPDHVFRNDRGHFVDVTDDWGFSEHEGRGLGVVAAHLDDDDKIDVYVANDMSANFLFRNLGNSRFEESALASGAASSADGGYKAGMGVGCGDLDGDGRIDLAVTNFYNESTTFYKNLGGGLFGDHTAAIGLAAPTRFLLGFGISLLDVDNDARLDLLSVNGHISDGRPAFPWKMPIQLLQGGPDGRLVDVSDRAGDPFQPLHLGRGLAQGDLDNDGRIDAIVLSQNDPLIYLHNRTVEAGHSITLLLQGTRSNRDAVGARLTLQAGGRRQVAQRIGGGSYQSAGDPRIHFGLADADRVERLEVRWPHGRVDIYEGLAADHEYLLKEGDAEAKALQGWKP